MQQLLLNGKTTGQ